MAMEVFKLVGRLTLDGVKKIQSQIQDIGTRAGTIGSTFKDVGQSVSTATNKMGESVKEATESIEDYRREMREAFQEQRKAMEPLRKTMMENQLNWFKMGQGAKDYSGTTKDFMREVQNLGAVHKKVTDQMMAQNTLALGGFLQSVGTILNRSGQSETIAQNFERMGNPLYTVNNGLLKVSGSLEGLARAGMPAVTALRMLGPTASMKDLNKMTRMLTQGQMRFQAVALASGIAVALLFGGLHKAAMANEEYANSFNTMKEKVRQAFQPMVDVFTSAMIPLFEFITFLADLTIAFNEAHPFLAKMIQGFLLLIPILTLLLSPLAIGAGLVNSFALAWSVLAPFIMPLITGLAAMSGTVLLVAAAIVALIAIGVLLYKNWDTIVAWLKSAWESMKAYAITLWGSIKDYFLNLWEGIKVIFSKALDFFLKWTPWGIMINAIIQNWSEIKQFFSLLWQGIKAIFQIVWNQIYSVITTVLNKVKAFLTPIFNFYKSIFTTVFNTIKTVITNVMSTIYKSISNTFNNVKAAMMKPIETAWSFIQKTLDKIKNAFSKLKLAFPKPKLPHFNVTAASKTIAGVKVPYPKVSLDWYAKGGIFDAPSIIGVGEGSSREAVVPLEGRYMRPFAEAIASQIPSNVDRGGRIIEVPVILNGREIARAMANDMDTALDRVRRISNRGRGR